MKLISVFCRWCNAGFCVCRRCWRGQAYCSNECRKAAKRKSHREAQRRYRQTEKGKKAHRLAENRRRKRKKRLRRNNMDDACSTSPPAMGYRTPHKEKKVTFHSHLLNQCHFCGRIGEIVPQFPRRAYGKSSE